MTGNLWQDWPVYILLGAVTFFFLYIIIKSRLDEKENKENQSNQKMGKK